MKKVPPIFWAIWAIAIVQTLSQHSINNSSDHFVFENVGQAVVGASYGHLVGEVDIGEFIDQHKKLENYIKTDIASILKAANSTLHNEQWERILSMFHSAGRAVEEVKFAFEKRDAVVYPANDPLRERRSFLGPLGFVTSIFDLGFSIYQETEISALKVASKANAKAIHALAVYAENVDLAVKKNTKNIAIVQKAITKTAEDLYQGKVDQAITNMLVQVEMAVVRWETTARSWADAILGLFKKQLSPNLLDFQMLRRGFYSLKKAAAQWNKKPVFSTMDSLENSEFSWTLEKNGKITIIIHILFAGHDRLKMYKFINMPHVLYNTTLGFLSIDEDVLGIDKKHGTGILTKSSVLEGCKKNRNVYACSNFGVLRTDIRESCLGYAFMGDSVGVARVCDFSFLRSDLPFVRQMGELSVGVGVPSKTVGTFHCGAGKDEAVIFETGSYVVTTNCSFAIGKFAFEPSRSLTSIKGNFMRIPTLLTLPLTFTNVLQDVEGIDTVLRTLDGIDPPQERSLAEVQRALLHMDDAQEALERRWSPMWALAVFLGLALLVGLIVCLVRRRAAYRRVGRGEREPETPAAPNNGQAGGQPGNGQSNAGSGLVSSIVQH